MARRMTSRTPYERVQVALESIQEGLQVISPEWRYLYLNPAAARQARKPVDKLLGRTMIECFPGIEATPVFARLEHCMRKQQADEMENEFVYDDGTRAWFELRMRPTSEGLVVVSLDITECKRLEANLVRNERLTALGQMAAGVAHNLGNILNPLVLNVELLARRTRADATAAASIEAMRTVLRRGTETVELLKRFHREATRPLVRVDLNQVATETEELCGVAAKQHDPPVVLRTDLGTPAHVCADAAELLGAIVNLVTNAIDALPAGGTIVVRTGACEAGTWVEVQDDGVGMTKEVQARAFEPFFTTKGTGGTGLGLATVYAFVRRHGGDVRLQSDAGRGTTIRLVFPSVP